MQQWRTLHRSLGWRSKQLAHAPSVAAPIAPPSECVRGLEKSPTATTATACGTDGEPPVFHSVYPHNLLPARMLLSFGLGLALQASAPASPPTLVNSAEFTTSSYEPNEEVFGSADRDALIARALSLSAWPQRSRSPVARRSVTCRRSGDGCSASRTRFAARVPIPHRAALRSG